MTSEDRLLRSGDGLELQVFADAEELREYLDALNEAGEMPTAVGIDSCPQPFLIALVGPYAEGEHVITDSPWEHDHDVQGRAVVCDECQGWHLGIDDLRYPVTVLVQTLRPDERDYTERYEDAVAQGFTV